MSSTINIIRGCDHIVTTKQKEYISITMIKNKLIGFPDQFPSNINACRIDSIHSINGFEYTRDIHYSQTVSKNIIEWTSTSKVPAGGEEYRVTGLFELIKTNKYTDLDCTRCGGNGWYVDILNNMSSVKGIDKVSQDVIKILFTPKLSDDGYGSSIKDILGENIYNEESLVQKINKSVGDCLTQIREMQGALTAEGYELQPEEILESISVENVLFIREETTCYIELKIINFAGDYLNFTFKI